MLYCHLYCNIKCYFSSSEAHWQNQLQEVLYEKGVLTNFLKETLLQVFSYDFSEICTTTFFTKLLWAAASVYRTMSNIYDRTFLWKYRRSRPEVFFKKMFLEISQNSQESTCARASFLIKLFGISFWIRMKYQPKSHDKYTPFSHIVYEVLKVLRIKNFKTQLPDLLILCHLLFNCIL